MDEIYKLAHKTDRVSVLDVYGAIRRRAATMRDSADNLKSETYMEDARALTAVADELYMVASALENTNEINPITN